MDIPVVFYWLLLGAGLQLFGFGRWMNPLTPWLVPVFLLFFTHSMPLISGMLWVWLALFFALGISLRGIVPIPGVAYLILPAVLGLLGVLPYAIDKLVAPLLPGFWLTLVFPVTLTAFEFINSRLNPYGTWGANGYTQYGVLPLMQLVSVTGVWGISFMIGWFASVVNWAWQHQFKWNIIQQGILIFVTITGTILFFGGIRIARANEAKTVRVAGIGWPKGITEPEEFMQAVEPHLSNEKHQALRLVLLRVQDSFLQRSEREARAGAKIIVWPETNLMVYLEDESNFIEQACAFAREHAVYLVMGMATLSPDKRYRFKNHAVFITPTGKIAYDYTKITAVPGFEKQYSIPGDKPIAFADSEYGRIASPICYDMDFDSIINQVGKDKVDIMLVPASDWKDIIPLHQQIAEFRAIENGTVLFRITRWGSSGAVDVYGRRLAYMDDFAVQDNVMVAQLPIQAGVVTLYSKLGNAFGWLCVMGLLACFVLWVSALSI